MKYLGSCDSQCYINTQNRYHLPWHYNLNYYHYLYINLKHHGSVIKCISTMKYLGSCNCPCYRYTQNSYHLPWHYNHNYYYYLYIDFKRHSSMIKCLYISTMRYLDSRDSQCYRYTQNSYNLPWHHNLNYNYYLYIDQKLHCSMIKCLYISTVKYLGSCNSQFYMFTQNTYYLPLLLLLLVHSSETAWLHERVPIHINDEVLQLPLHKSETSWFHDPVSIQINDEVFGFFL